MRLKTFASTAAYYFVSGTHLLVTWKQHLLGNGINMEAAPPSYETATLVNPWDLVAEWLPSNDLCSAALVSSSWHTIFTPHLWGNPAAHFGTENDRVYGKATGTADAEIGLTSV